MWRNRQSYGLCCKKPGLGYVTIGAVTHGCAGVVTQFAGARAQNTGTRSGLNSGDKLCLTFNDQMNMRGGTEVQKIVPLGGSFTVTLAGETTTADLKQLPMLNPSSTALEVQSALESLTSVGHRGVAVRRDWTAAEGGWVVTFTPSCRSCAGNVPLLEATPPAAAAVTELQAGHLLTSQQVHDTLQFSSVVASEAQGEWVDPRTLCVVFDEISPRSTAVDTRVGDLVVFIKPSAGFMSVHRNEVPMRASKVVTGTWGAHATPKVVSAWTVNMDHEPYAGVGDILYIQVGGPHLRMCEILHDRVTDRGVPFV